MLNLTTRAYCLPTAVYTTSTAFEDGKPGATDDDILAAAKVGPFTKMAAVSVDRFKMPGSSVYDKHLYYFLVICTLFASSSVYCKYCIEDGKPGATDDDILAAAKVGLSTALTTVSFYGHKLLLEMCTAKYFEVCCLSAAVRISASTTFD